MARDRSSTPRQPPCWWCSKPLSNPFGKPIKGVERKVDGNMVRMHKVCSHDFNIEFRKITAQPKSGAAMDLYLSDALGDD